MTSESNYKTYTTDKNVQNLFINLKVPLFSRSIKSTNFDHLWDEKKRAICC